MAATSGSRLRSDPRPLVHALLLRAFGRRHARGGRRGSANGSGRVVRSERAHLVGCIRPPNARRCPDRRRVVAEPAAKASPSYARAIVLAAFGVRAAGGFGEDQPATALCADDPADAGRFDDRRRLWLALGTLTIIAYLAVGALGLPVFAGPVGGLKPLTGATAGFLSGFVVAAFVTGWFSERGWDRSMVRLFVVMAIGHIVIMAMGFALAGLRYEARRRESLVGRRDAVPGGGISEEHIGRDPGTRPARNG